MSSVLLVCQKLCKIQHSKYRICLQKTPSKCHRFSVDPEWCEASVFCEQKVYWLLLRDFERNSFCIQFWTVLEFQELIQQWNKPFLWTANYTKGSGSRSDFVVLLLIVVLLQFLGNGRYLWSCFSKVTRSKVHLFEWDMNGFDLLGERSTHAIRCKNFCCLLYIVLTISYVSIANTLTTAQLRNFC